MKSLERWELRVSAIGGAIVRLLALHPDRHCFTAPEIAAQIPMHAWLAGWTQRQFFESAAWIQRAGRREFVAYPGPQLIAPRPGESAQVVYENGRFTVHSTTNSTTSVTNHAKQRGVK